MALPSNVGSGTVTGRLIDSNGLSIDGKVVFTPSPDKLLNVDADPSPVTILPKPVTVDLVEGSFTQELVATDDPDNNPSGWTYKVDFKLTGASLKSFSIEVPEGATVDLTTVAPVSTSNGVTITRGVGVPDGGATGQVLAKASGDDYDTHWVNQSGGGGGEGGAVDSVNGQTGAVVLDAADVGALPDSTTIPNSADDVGARPDTWVPSWSDVTGKPSTFPPATHNHDDRYYTESEVDNLLSGKADAGGGGAELTNQTVNLDASDDTFAHFTVVDDGTATGGWPDRLLFNFQPQGGDPKAVSWFNEYGELRHIPAKPNTVGWRMFIKASATDPARGNDAWQVCDNRDDRNVIVSIDEGGLRAANLPNSILSQSQEPQSPSVGDVWIDTSGL